MFQQFIENIFIGVLNKPQAWIGWIDNPKEKAWLIKARSEKEALSFMTKQFGDNVNVVPCKGAKWFVEDKNMGINLESSDKAIYYYLVDKGQAKVAGWSPKPMSSGFDSCTPCKVKMLKKIHEEFSVKILREDIGFKISLCGLCGNCGIIDTRNSATWNDKKVGLISYCICENGRALKETTPNLSIQEMEDKISCMAMKMF